MRWLAAALLMGGLAVPAAAAAQVDADTQRRSDELGLTVVAGYEGRAASWAWQPVTVGLEPARPLRGTLSVRSRDQSRVESVPVEVAAGSRKVYRFLAAPGAVEVGLAEEGAEPLTVRPPDQAQVGEYLVGLVGGGAGNLPPLRSETTGRSGAWVAIDPAWLDVSAFALEPLSAVVVDPDDLQGLGPRGMANLAAGVAAGTDLIVTGVEERGADLEAMGLPWSVPETTWRMESASAFPVGKSRVVLTPTTPGEAGMGRSAAFWSTLAQPRERAGQPSEFQVTRVAHQFSRLLAERGSSAPVLPGLGAFVAIYVLVVGPVNAVVLGRLGRRELAWATVPLITVVFTTGAFLGATTARPPAGGAARLTYWAEGVPVEFIAAGVRTPTPGVRQVTLPGDTWTVSPVIDGGGRDVTVSRAGDTAGDTTVSMDLTALQLGGIAAWRTTDAAAPLSVEATATAEGVQVTVRNVSGRALSDVVVRLATTARTVGDLAAGAEEVLAVDSPQLPMASGYRDPFEGLAAGPDGIVGAPASLRAVLNAEIADGRPGMAWVSAVDAGAPAPDVRAGGDRVTDRGSLVAVGVRVRQERGALSPYTIDREGVFGGNGFRPGPEAFEGSGDAFLHFRLPPGAESSQLTNQLDRSRDTGGRPDITLWDGVQRQWIPAAEAFADRDRLVGPLGDVWARASGEFFPFEYSARTIAGARP